MINSTKILSTKFDGMSKRWIVNFSTPAGEHTVVSKHLVQATGIGSQKPYVPAMQNEELFSGISIHSARYKNGKEMVKKGAKVSFYTPLDHDARHWLILATYNLCPVRRDYRLCQHSL